MNYNDVYVEKLIKLYEKYIDSIPFGKHQGDGEQIKRILEILYSILNSTLKVYLNKYDKVLNRYTYDLDEELVKLRDLMLVIEERDQFVTKYINMYEKRILEKVTDNILDFIVSAQLDPLRKKISLIEKYNNNREKIKVLKNENIKNKQEIQQLNELMIQYRDENNQMDKKFNKTINKLLIEYGIYNIDKDNVYEYYPKYQELYLKAREQRENNKFDLSNIYDMAVENYNAYNFKYQLLNLSSIINLEYDSYDSYCSKLDKTRDIIDNIKNHPIYDKINDVLESENERLFKQKIDINKLNNVKNSAMENDDLIKELIKDNNCDEIRKITNQFIVNDKIFKDEKVVGKEDLEKPLIKKKSYDEDNIISVDSSPEWVVNEINKNEYKFINWFKKVNNLIVGEN